MSVPTRRILDPIFGRPTLYSRNNSRASWDRADSPGDQKSATGWLAALTGGLQTGDDYARVNIPVNEMRVPDFKTALWSYYMTTSDSFGVNMVIWLHDPEDFDNRVEVTQAADTALLIKTSGWNAHELDVTAEQFYWYGEDDAAAVASGLTEGVATQYGWDDFQADALFRNWTIYRITFEFGWQASGTFGTASVADIKLNNVMIPMGPASGRHMRTIVASKTMLGSAKTTGEVISEATSSGTDWDFAFGGTGYITKAIITHNAAITPRVSLLLFSRPPTGELDDEGTNTSPISADVPYYVGRIDFPAMGYNASGDASAIATPSTVGNLPIAFDAPTLYGVLIAIDTTTTVAEALYITLSADMEDN